jgi:hypothetical protein
VTVRGTKEARRKNVWWDKEYETTEEGGRKGVERMEEEQEREIEM